MERLDVTLRPLTAADLPLVEPWFDERDTQRFVGSRPWPRRALELAEAENRAALLACQGGVPVALVDVERDESDPDQSYCALVVAPARRRQGIAQATLRALLARPDLCGARLQGGVHEVNRASWRMLEKLGFTLDAPDTDDDGFLYYSHATV